MSNIVKIGSFEIEVSPNHMYLTHDLPPTYDYVPWNLISNILNEGGRPEAGLIDIGANAGDSIAHFRRRSNATALGIEPEPSYFKMLKANARTLGNIDLRNALLVPEHLIGKTSFSAQGQTGMSKAAQEGDAVWRGKYLTVSEMMNWSKGAPVVLKTDTDGFDAQIMHGVIPYLGRHFVPIVFFEGPSRDQHLEANYDDYLSVCRGLQGIGYKLLLLTNIGFPYAYVGTNTEALASCFRSLTIGHQWQGALCHYFDVIALHPAVTSDLHSLKRDWGSEIYSRD